VLLALLNDASFYAGGQIQRVSGKELMRHAAPYYISPAYAFVAYPNRDSTPFRKFYNIPEAETIIRGTLRYQGFPEFIGALVKLGWLDEGNKEWLTSEITWAQALQMSIGTSDATERYVHPLFAVHTSQSFKSNFTALSSRGSRGSLHSQLSRRRDAFYLASSGSVCSRTR
jgi:saccharopine dehydrogenase-like NADP-dependent oxidoreductase